MAVDIAGEVSKEDSLFINFFPRCHVSFSFSLICECINYWSLTKQVDIHNDILGEISEEMERADVRLARETRNMKVIMIKSKSHWGLWLLIVLLLIAILVCSVVKK